jgi:type III pantothenate kinase
MILTVIAGNTSGRLTWFDGDKVRCRRVMPTGRLAAALRAHPLWPDGRAALASVVPAVTPACVRALARLTGQEPLVVGPDTLTRLRFRYRRSQLGADRVCLAVGAHYRYRRDVIALDFGTATTVNVIGREGAFLGGTIVPGMQMMLDSLRQGTALLPELAPGTSWRALGHDTRSALQAGVCHLLAGGVERIISGIERHTGRSFFVVATGGAARQVRPGLRRIQAIDQDLAARGLARICQDTGG